MPKPRYIFPLSFDFAMADPKSRARVERLLRGDFRPDDLTGLFLFARDHCDGREAITDIGDFVAHHSERDRGLITRSTRDWFAVARFHMSSFRPNQPRVPYEWLRMPPSTQDYFRIAINRLDAEAIRQRTGLSRSGAYKVMTGLVARLTKNPDGTWALPANPTQTEISLVECVSSFLVTRGAFKAESLCDDFIATLKSNGLITKDEIREHQATLNPLVQLYAVSAMHNCVVQIGDGTTTQLKANIHRGSREIAVDAAVPMVLPGANGFWSTSMFVAKVDPNIHCHPDLLTGDVWDFEIEVAPDRRLSPMR